MSDRLSALREFMAEKRDVIDIPFRSDMGDLVARAFRRPLRIRPDQFADKYRKLPSTNKSHGQWRSNRYNVAVGVFAAMTQQNVAIITGVACTQIFKTSTIETGIFFFGLADPSPMIFCSATEDLVDKMSKTKFQPMFEQSPRARGRYRELLVKFFSGPGWFLHMAMAKSVASMAGISVRISFADEIDKPEWDEVEGHGNPLDNLESRVKSYGRKSKRIRMSSPTVESGRIWQSYLQSDMRKPFVSCPHCGEDQLMRWKQWRHDESDVRSYDLVVHDAGREFSIRPELDETGEPVIDETGQAVHHYHCPYCQNPWSDQERLRALQSIVWRQCRPFTHCGREQNPEIARSWTHVVEDDGLATGYATCEDCGQRRVPVHHAGFWANRFYDPEATHTGFMSLFLEMKKTKAGLMSFVNNELAEIFVEGRFSRVTAEEARVRAEQFDAPMPRRAIMITAGVDVQGTVLEDGGANATARLAYELVAWGAAGESWSLEYDEIPGDPRRNDVWNELTKRVTRPFARADGSVCYPRAVAIDIGGGFTAEAQRYVQRMGAGFYAVVGKAEGSQTAQAPIWPVSAKPGQARYEVGTQSAKDEIATSLQVVSPGPGFFHVDRSRFVDEQGNPNEAGVAWMDMVLSEEKVRARGARYRRWRKRTKDARNEGLDCRVYALGARMALERNDGISVEELGRMLGVPTDILPGEGSYRSAAFAAPAVAVVSPKPTKPPLPVIAASRPIRGGGARRR